MITKAFLLAAGLGTRLRPMTDTIPKCLVPICDKPLLGWWIDLMEKHGIEQVLINLHHLSDQVVAFINSYATKIKFHFFYEEKLLGSAGTLRENKEFIKDENAFFILYADNLTNYDLTLFSEFHEKRDQLLSMALFDADNPQLRGIAMLDKNDIIIDFEEKPKFPKSTLANAGLYIAKPEIIDIIPNLEITDIGYHLLPQLLGKMAGWKSNNFLLDIGTIYNFNKANKEWSQIIKRGR
ncbi:MAG: nucleotidyltransferase family protein [Bacteroidota bacterium]